MSPELVEALRMLGSKEPPALPSRASEVEAFSNAAAESEAAAYFDWKVTNLGVLEELMTRFDREIPLDIRMEGENCIVLVESEMGEEHITRIENLEALSRDAVVASFLKLLPCPHVALKLVLFETTDCDVYLVLPEPTATRVLSALGARGPELVKQATAERAAGCI